VSPLAGLSKTIYSVKVILTYVVSYYPAVK